MVVYVFFPFFFFVIVSPLVLAAPQALQRDVSASSSGVPEEKQIPMRRRLFEPKRAGEELRRYHEVTKQVIAEQRDQEEERKQAVTGARRAQNQERTFILSTQRKQDKKNVSTNDLDLIHAPCVL